MKPLALLLLFFVAVNANAIQKCVVDGKTIYMDGSQCPNGATQKSISKGTFSGVETSGVRQNIAIEEQQKQIDARTALERQAREVPNGSMTIGEANAVRERAKQAQRELGMRTATDDRIDALEKRMRVNKAFRAGGWKEPY